MEASKKKTIAIVILVVLVVFGIMFGAKEFGQKQNAQSIAANKATIDKAVESSNIAKESKELFEKYKALGEKYETCIKELEDKINRGEAITAEEEA
ncbi:hypothetical protein [Eubacterium sp. 1001713B170207_170306_E7]|uniref:hypothetical protein n=1 Tax=Eubacterium sp. 1001713B170207_170306_E7 TaxID=2787097 RepID=UPI0018986B8F|nr:hypothetical protein [Eubacterium sp. 1001713B170207_170306_E7]